MKKYSIFLFLLLSLFSAQAQGEQGQYIEAKRLFDAGQYTSAKVAFGSLTTSEVFGAHAGFYYALSAYRQGDPKGALLKWDQVLIQFPRWKQLPEVLFWLAYVSLEEGQHERGLRYAIQLTERSLNSETEEVLTDQFIAPLPLETIQELYEIFPDNRYLAATLVRKLNDEPYQLRDFTLINQLITRWNLEMDEISDLEYPIRKKEVYEVAVMLPFLFESLENTTVISQNTLVMDLYQGMLLAAEELEAVGNPVKLLPFDTKRNEQETRKLLEEPQMQAIDLIIGPLFPGPNQAVNAFSKAYRINTVNPISSTRGVIADNPYSFLMRPSFETQALKLAELAIEENENKYAMILYEETERDSSFAATYKNAIEQAGFEVVLYQGMNKENAKALLDMLVAQYEVFLTQKDADSLKAISGRNIKQRRVRKDEKERMEREQRRAKEGFVPFNLPISWDENGNEIVYYENIYHMKPDSIGHILGATRSNLYANNLISSVEARPDSLLRLYGYGEWIDFTMLSYAQLDRLGVALSHPDYIEKSNYGYQDLAQKFRSIYKTEPSINHIRGYELVWYLGNMMHRHGTYFQRGLQTGTYRPGKALEGFRYGAANDNQVVPIVRFRNAKLEVVNRSFYEN